MTEVIVTSEEIRHHLFYEKETGLFLWRLRKQGRQTGTFFGCKDKDGYFRIHLNHRLYLAHRLAWMYVHGHIPDGLFIDHINGNRADNRIENLRPVTHLQNMQNVGIKHTPSKLQLFLKNRENTYSQL